MGYFSIIAVAFALSLDAFAVAVTCGIKLKVVWIKKFFKIALFFGLFQAGMPLVGWGIGHFIKDFIDGYAGLISFTVFGILGAKTLIDAYRGKHYQDCGQCTCSGFKCLSTLAVATSIDAFLVGLILGLYPVHVLVSVGIIGGITFLVSLVGCLIGNRTTHVIGKKSEIAAGIILIILAITSLF